MVQRITVQQAVPHRTLPRIALVLLILAALGQLYNNLALARIGSFVVGIPLLLLIGATTITLITPRQRPADGALPLLWGVLIAWQVFVGVALGRTSDREWLQPFMLFTLYTTCFVIISRLSISYDDLNWAMVSIGVAVLIFGGLGILQFFLLNLFQLVPTLPPELSAVVWQPTIDIYRTGGFLRPAGLSYEPATYSIALSVALVLFILMSSLTTFRQRGLIIVSGLCLVVASLLTLSLAGWAVALPALLVGALHKRFRHFTLPVIILVAALLLAFTYAGFAPVVSTRLADIAAGSDASANIRVLAAVSLLVEPSRELALSFTGGGWGQGSEFWALMDAVYLGRFGMDVTDIHNIFTIVRVSQGWVGIVLHLLLLLAIVRPGVRHNRTLYLPALVMILTLHFASGFYLDPVFWALLGLIAVLRDSDAVQELKGQGAVGWRHS